MKISIKKLLAFLTVTASVIIIAAFGMTASAEEGKWVAAWGSGMTEVGVGEYEDIGVIIGNTTCRSIITPSVSGKRIRLLVSNVYGKSDLTIKKMTVAKSLGESTINASTVVHVTFGGNYGVTIPAGKELYSDPVDFAVEAMELVAVSSYVENFNEIRTCGFSGGNTYLTIGDSSSDGAFGFVSVKLRYSLVSVVPSLSAMDVYTEDEDAYSVVVIGDSTVANEFPFYLARSIVSTGNESVGIVGKGIIGNSLLEDGVGIGEKIYGPKLLTRFDADALKQSGVKYVVLKIGCNDIVHPKSGDSATEYNIVQPTPAQMIAGFTEIAERCHAAGIKIVMVKIMQWKGYSRDFFNQGPLYTYSDSDWQIACEVNDWLDHTDVFDSVVDLNKYSVSDNDPAALNSEYTEDGCHPNDTLQLLWADKFPLSTLGVPVPVKTITLSNASKLLPLGKMTQLKATINPEDATNPNIVWTSSNPAVATVNSNGLVRSVSLGTAVITCRSQTYNRSSSCKVTVYKAVTSVSLKRETLRMYKTQQKQFTAYVLPEDASDKGVRWTSSNTAVAKVNSDGLVTAVSPGDAIITCTTFNGGLKDSCAINVGMKYDVRKLTLNTSVKYIDKGKISTLTATVTPSYASNKGVTWTSTNPKVATISATGRLVALSGGNATIICKSDDSGIFAVCRVYVKSYVKYVSLAKYDIDVYTGKNYFLFSRCTPADVTNTTLAWSSSNNSVATVSSNGTITGIREGKAVITAKATDGSGVSRSCNVTVKKWIAVTGLSLSNSKISVRDGSSVSLTATVYPYNATLMDVTWSSENKKIATVNANGVVTAVSTGTTKITCTSKDNRQIKKTCTVTVYPNPVTGVTLNNTKLNLDDGKTFALKATVSPENATNKNITWSSNNKAVATVSSSGVVTAVKPGTAKITVTTASGGFSATCTVTVKAIAVTGLSLSKSNQTIKAGTSFTLVATVLPSNATNKNVSWSTGNAAIAKVSSTGVVTGIAEGTTVIYCQTKDGNIKKGCIVTVQATPVLGIRLNVSSTTIKVGKTYQLVATVLPAEATNKQVKWTTSNASVALVGSSGIVVGLSKGQARITATTVDGSFKASCTVFVQ